MSVFSLHVQRLQVGVGHNVMSHVKMSPRQFCVRRRSESVSTATEKACLSHLGLVFIALQYFVVSFSMQQREYRAYRHHAAHQLCQCQSTIPGEFPRGLPGARRRPQTSVFVDVWHDGSGRDGSQECGRLCHGHFWEE